MGHQGLMIEIGEERGPKVRSGPDQGWEQRCNCPGHSV